jgi:hypothetical protein
VIWGAGADNKNGHVSLVDLPRNHDDGMVEYACFDILRRCKTLRNLFFPGEHHETAPYTQAPRSLRRARHGQVMNSVLSGIETASFLIHVKKRQSRVVIAGKAGQQDLSGKYAQTSLNR